jgi:endonuclease-3 related protein
MTSETLTEIYRLLFESFGPQHWWPGQTRFEIITGAILTQNTNWSNVEKAIANLRAYPPSRLFQYKGETPEKLFRLAF